MTHALIVEDDVDAAEALRALIASENFTVATAHTLRDARGQILLQKPDIVLLDLQLPDGNGMELLADIDLLSNSEVVLITGYASIETSIQALRMGAADYLVKPIAPRQLQGVLSRLMKPSVLQAEVADLEAELAEKGRFGQLWGRSPAMRRVYQQLSRVAGTAVSVFVTGESGTGKELVAQTLHELSRRRKMPFLAVNCGAISPRLIESEVFGHEKGSFTGAERQHQGFFERASGGTLFLDEVTEMPLDLQVKLLRVLETGRFMRVGSSTPIEADVRIVAASNRVPAQAVAAGKLREDLFYRLNVFPIELPPLRDRLVDVPLLAQHFLDTISGQERKPKRFSAQAFMQLASYRWPGNVRELRNAVQRAYVMAPDSVIDDQWLPKDDGRPLHAPTMNAGVLVAAGSGRLAAGSAAAPSSLGRTELLCIAGDTVTVRAGCSLADAERALIVTTLRHYQHHKERAAAALGISLKTLYNRLKDYAEDEKGDADPAA